MLLGARRDSSTTDRRLSQQDELELPEVLKVGVHSGTVEILRTSGRLADARLMQPLEPRVQFGSWASGLSHEVRPRRHSWIPHGACHRPSRSKNLIRRPFSSLSPPPPLFTHSVTGICTVSLTAFTLHRRAPSFAKVSKGLSAADSSRTRGSEFIVHISSIQQDKHVLRHSPRSRSPRRLPADPCLRSRGSQLPPVPSSSHRV
jgi:hypothetical protein